MIFTPPLQAFGQIPIDLVAEVKNLHQELPPQQSSEQDSPSQQTSNYLNPVLVSEQSSSKSRQSGIVIRRWSELSQTESRSDSYVVNELLLSGGTSLLAAKPKEGKSTLARQLAANLVKGQPFLGRSTKIGKVLYFALDDRTEDISRHLNQLGVESDEDIFVIAAVQGITVQSAFEAIRQVQPVLVIVDTMIHLLRVKDLNDYAKVSNAMEPFKHIARETGAHILFVHHAKKTSSSDSPFDSVLGSTAIIGMVDTIMIMREGKNGARTISSKGRYDGADMEETTLLFNKDERLYSLGQTTQEAQLIARSAALEELKSRILHFVELHPGCTRSEIEVAVTGNAQLISDALSALRNERLHTEGTGRKGSPFRFYADIPVEAGHDLAVHQTFDGELSARV